MAVWGLIALAAASVASAGIAAATQPDAPESPDLRAATREGFLADIETLPRRKEIEAAARVGGELLKEGYTKKKGSVPSELPKLQAQLREAKAVIDKGAPVKPTVGGRDFTTSTAQTDYQKSLEAYQNAQQTYNALNLRVAELEQKPAEGGEDLYYGPDGNIVTRAEALEKDFTGISDIDQSVEAARAQLRFMEEQAQATLDLNKKFGSDFIQQELKMLQEADPIGFQMREEMGRRILSEGFGTDLSREQKGEVQQSTRAAQSARGNIFGAAPAAAEAMSVGDAGFRRQQQRFANAAAFMSGQTPQAQFGQLSNAGQGTVPQGTFNLIPGIGPNQSAGAQGAAFGANIYGQQSQNYATGLQSNPWQSLLGSVTQMGVNAGAQALFAGGGGGVAGAGGQTYYPFQGNGGTAYGLPGGF